MYHGACLVAVIVITFTVDVDGGHCCLLLTSSSISYVDKQKAEGTSPVTEPLALAM